MLETDRGLILLRLVGKFYVVTKDFLFVYVARFFFAERKMFCCEILMLLMQCLSQILTIPARMLFVLVQ